MNRTRRMALNDTLGKCKLYNPTETCKKFDLSSFIYVLPERTYNTTVTVAHMDTLEAAAMLENPVALNMANAYNPGGGWLQLCGAQEESLFFRSGLCKHLEHRFYPLKGAEALYARDVPVWFGTEASGYPDVVPKLCSFITCAATDGPTLTASSMLPNDEVDLLLQKIYLVFYIAYAKGHRNIVLSAFGCGAFRNPPEHVARLFAVALREWDGIFEKVFFAILGANFDVFDAILGTENVVHPNSLIEQFHTA